MQTLRGPLAVALLMGALGLLAPAGALARTHAPRARAHRLCARNRTHARLHGDASRRRRARRGGRLKDCSGHARTRRRSAGPRRSGAVPVSHTPHAPAAAAAESCQDTDLQPSEANLALVREATLCLINRERSRAGKQPLSEDGALTNSAQGHSTSMARHGYFEHVSPGGSTPVTRMRESGYLSSSTPSYEVGENIAWGSNGDSTPAAIVAAWMASPPHRANILERPYRDTGIGISPNPPGSFAGGATGAFYTEDFGVLIGS